MTRRLIARRGGRPQVRGSLIYLVAALALSALLVVTATIAVTGKRIGSNNTSVSDADADSMDCDADDRARREIPDCGRKVDGKYREWSWVRAGKKTPPVGWSPRQETAGSPPTPARTSTRTTSSGGTNLLDGRSRRATTNGNNSGTGTNRSNGGTNRRS